MNILPATLADAPALLALINRAYRSDAPGWTAEGHLLAGPRLDAEALRALLTAAPARLLKAESGAGALAGCVYLEPQSNALYLSTLTVAPEAQARGLGRQLLAAAEAWARELALPAVRLSVLDARPELLAWYERRGYERTGEAEPFPADSRFGRPRQPLTLLTLAKKVRGA